MTFRGFSPRIRSPRILVDKLERDLSRIKANPHDADAAFDFFVTADHVEEWLAHGVEVGGPPERP